MWANAAFAGWLEDSGEQRTPAELVTQHVLSNMAMHRPIIGFWKNFSEVSVGAGGTRRPVYMFGVQSIGTLEEFGRVW